MCYALILTNHLADRNMREPKLLDFGVVILCPDQSAKTLLNTVRSIRHFSDAPCIAVVPKSTKCSVTEDMKAICDLRFGRDTYTSLMNVGLGKTGKDWNFILFAGSLVKPNFWARYTCFIENEFDVLYSVSHGRYNFIDSSLNGLLLHVNSIKRVGKFYEGSNLEEAKAVWGYAATRRKYRFKGILTKRIVG